MLSSSRNKQKTDHHSHKRLLTTLYPNIPTKETRPVHLHIPPHTCTNSTCHTAAVPPTDFTHLPDRMNGSPPLLDSPHKRGSGKTRSTRDNKKTNHHETQIVSTHYTQHNPTEHSTPYVVEVSLTAICTHRSNTCHEVAVLPTGFTHFPDPMGLGVVSQPLPH